MRKIVTVPTRNDSILDWCFTNKPNLLSKPVQLPKIGCGDHNALLIKPLNSNQFSNLRTKSQMLRDTRASLLRAFGQWITTYDRTAILNISDVQSKFDLLHSCLMKAVNTLFPAKKVKISASDKPWTTSAVKSLIAQRQKALVKWGSLLTTTSGFGIESRKSVLNIRNVFMRTKYLAYKTQIFLDGGRTSKIWVAFRSLVIGHLS